MKVLIIVTILFGLFIHFSFMPVVQSFSPFQLGSGFWFVGAFLAGVIVKAATK